MIVTGAYAIVKVSKRRWQVIQDGGWMTRYPKDLLPYDVQMWVLVGKPLPYGKAIILLEEKITNGRI